jgi:hypothetical protein
VRGAEGEQVNPGDKWMLCPACGLYIRAFGPRDREVIALHGVPACTGSQTTWADLLRRVDDEVPVVVLE